MQSLIWIYFFILAILFGHIQAQEQFWIPLPGLGTVPTTTTRPVNDLNAQFQLSLNTFRAAHGAAALTFSATLQAQAKVCADAYAAGTFTPTTPCRPTGDYSQVFSPTNPGEPLPDPAFFAQATAAEWYKESAFLVPPLTYIATTYNVRQMLWKATSQFGCAVSVQLPATANNIFVFCVYNPVGNVEVLVGSDTLPGTFPTTDLVANVQP